MTTVGDTKTYIDRPAGQPNYVPQSYTRPAPGGALEAFVMPPSMAEHIAEIRRRWMGVSPDKDGDTRH